MDCFVNENRSNAYAVDYYNGEVVRIPILKQKIVTVAQRIKHEGSSVDPKRQDVYKRQVILLINGQLKKKLIKLMD